MAMSESSRARRTQAIVTKMKDKGYLPEDADPYTIAGVKFKTYSRMLEVPDFCRFKAAVERSPYKLYKVKVPDRLLTEKELQQLLKLVIVRA